MSGPAPDSMAGGPQPGAPQDPDLVPIASAAPTPTPGVPAQPEDPDLVPIQPTKDESAPTKPPLDPDLSAMTAYTKNNLDAHAQSMTPAAPTDPDLVPQAGIVPSNQKPATTFVDALEAGWQMSVEGLIKRGAIPDKVLPQDAGWAMRMLSFVGQAKGDLLPMAAGMIGGGAAGGAVGLEGGPLALVTGAAGAAYGTWAAPAALRSALMQHYVKGDIQSPTDFLQRAGAVFLDQLKAGVTGAAAELTGGIVGGFSKFMGAAPLAVTTSNLAGQVAAMTTVGKAMEGHLPKAQDFTDAAMMLGVFHALSSAAGINTSAFPGNEGAAPGGAPGGEGGLPALPAPPGEGGPAGPAPGSTHFPGSANNFPLTSELNPNTTATPPESAHGQLIAGKLQSVYAKTGLRPEQVVEDAKSDPALLQELASSNKQFPTKYEPLVQPPQKGQEVFGGEPPKTIEMGSNSEWNQMHPALSSDFTNARGFDVPAPPEPEAPAAAGGGSGGNEPPIPPELTPEAEHVRSRWDSSTPAEKKALTSGDFITAVLDNTHPLKQLQDAMNGKRPALTADENPQIQLRRSRGAYAAADNMVSGGPVDFHTYARTGTAGLEDIFKRAGDPHAFNDYLVADAAVKVAKRGIQSGVEIDKAKATVKQGKARFGELAQEVYDFRNEALKYQADSGFYSKDEYKAMTSESDRVGLYRVQEPSEQRAPGGPTSRTAKKIIGGKQIIVAPSESLVKEAYARVRAAEQNRVTTLLSDLYENNWVDHPGGDLAPEDKDFPTRKVGEQTQINRSTEMTKVETQMRPVKVTAAELQKYLDENEIEGTAENDLTTFRPNWRPLGANEIENWRDGNREIFKVNKDVADALRSIDPGSANIIAKVLSPPAKLLSMGATHNPFFLMKHWLRQEMMAGVISQNGYVPFAHAIAGVYHILANTEVNQMAQAAGALQGAITDVNKDYIQKSIFSLSKQTGLLDRQQNVIATPKELVMVAAKLLHSLTIAPAERAMTGAANTVFNSTKVAEFGNVTRGNYSPESLAKGAIAARNVSYDSSKVGAQVRAVNGMISFWHPRAQGVEQLAEAIKDRPISSSMKLAAMAAVGALLWWANKDDPRRRSGTRSEQDLYWHIMTDDWQPVPRGRPISPDDYTRVNPKTGETELNMGHVYRVTKPFEAGIISSSLLERVLDARVDKDPEAFKGFGDSIMHGMMPDTILTALVPAIEKASNKSLLTGSTIIPHNLENVLPAEQYTQYTSETAKVLGKFIASTAPNFMGLNKPGSWASPIIIDNTISAWSGEAGRYATAIGDQLLYKSGVVPPKIQATPTLADNIFAHSFVARYPTMGDRNISDFFDNSEETQALIATAKEKMVRGDVNGSLQMRISALEGGSLEGARTAIINQMHLLKTIDMNPTMPPNDKRQLEDGLIMLSVSAAKRANQQVDALKKALNDSK